MSISRTSSIRNPNLILVVNPVVLENVHMLLSSKLNYQHVKHILFNSHVICLAYDKPVSDVCYVVLWIAL